jgi:hypothetical protein
MNKKELRPWINETKLSGTGYAISVENGSSDRFL